MKVIVLALTVALTSLSSARILETLPGSNVIPGKYIVKLTDGTDSRSFLSNTSLLNVVEVLVPLTNCVEFTYDSAFNGFSAALDERQLLSLDTFEKVEYIEPDQVMKASVIQPNTTWNLARVSSINKLIGTLYNYYYNTNLGPIAKVYIIDTGININNTDFGGRATLGYNAITNEPGYDLNGHGTHVAGIVGGNIYGIEKQAKLVAVKVLDATGSGATSGVIAGINWVKNNAPRTGSVINMSLGGSTSTSLDTAVTNAINAGITTVVAAGNEETDACSSSPARVPKAITVAASDVNDMSASFTNFGDCVDIYAPGVNITSDWIGSTSATNTISGTSMASPHVAGLAAYFIREYNLTTPQDIENKIKQYAHNDAISDIPDNFITIIFFGETPNLLIYNNYWNSSSKK